MEVTMAILGPLMLGFCIVGTMRFTKLRDNWAGIIGIPGSYVLFTGIIMLFSIIGTLISLITGGEPDTSELLPGIIITLVCLAYGAYVIFFKCQTTKQRILLPLVACLIGAGFVWRLMAAIVFKTPMSSGNTDADDTDLNTMPVYIYDDKNEQWTQRHKNADHVVYVRDSQEVIIRQGSRNGSYAIADNGMQFHWY